MMHDKRTPLSRGHILYRRADNGVVEYEVTELLGRGGSGLLYLCKNGNTSYAVKELYPKELMYSLQRLPDEALSFVEGVTNEKTHDIFQWYQKNIRKEAFFHQTAANSRATQNNDPFFLRCEGVFNYNGTSYVVYHTAEGQTLKAFLEEHSHITDIESYLETVLSAIAITAKKLQCVHQANLLHLDISPTNIYMVDHGDGAVPYLIDFGSAYLFDGSETVNHRYSTTEGFSAPELYCRSEGNFIGNPVSLATDTYSLAAVLFYALYGQKTYDDYVWCQEDMKTLLQQYPHADKLFRIFKKGLGEQHSRYQSAEEFCQDILKLLDLLPNKSQDMRKLLTEIDFRLEAHTETITQLLKQFTNTITDEIKEDGRKTRKDIANNHAEIQKTKRLMPWIAASVSVLLIICLAIITFADFEPPEFELLCSDYMNEESSTFEISGTLLEFCITAKDNKSLEDRTITENDIILNGFSAEKEFVDLYNGYYSIRLTSIQKIADTCSIQVREGCVKDNQGHKSAAKTIPVLFVDKAGDRTVPTIAMSHPTGTNGSNLIEAGANIVIKLWLSDNEKLSRENVSAEYIHAVGFTYDEMIVHGNNGEYTITFSRVRGATGRYYIYVAPGIAVDDNKNYSFGIKSSEFYLYNEKSEIDTSAPALTISSATVTGNTVEYHIAANDNVGLYSFMLRPEDITLVGFSANIIIEYESTSSVTQSVRIIRFTNVVSTSSNPQKYFILNSGIAKDAFGNQTKAKISPVFDCPE